MNVWTHLAGFFIFLFITIYYGYEVDYWHNRSSWGLLGFGIGCMIYALLSTMAHLFHSKSLPVHYTCFQFDYVGIGLSTQSLAMLFYTCSGTPLFYKTVAPYYMHINYVLGIMVCLCCIYTHIFYYDDLQKQQAFAVSVTIVHAMFLFTPFLFRVYECLHGGQHCHSDNAGLHITHGIWSIVSIFWFISLWPQRSYPGTFDLFGQSHQIFHIAATIASVLEFRAGIADWRAMEPDLKNWLNTHVQVDQIFGSLLITIIVGFIFIFLMRHNVKQLCDRQEKEEKLLANETVLPQVSRFQNVVTAIQNALRRLYIECIVTMIISVLLYCFVLICTQQRNL